jgi:hypothetical protein
MKTRAALKTAWEYVPLDAAVLGYRASTLKTTRLALMTRAVRRCNRSAPATQERVLDKVS